MKKKDDKLRGFVFYPQDYFGDGPVRLMPTNLRCCWIEMFFKMDQSPRRGVLLKPNFDPYTAAELAVIVNTSVQEVELAMEWVVRERIASIDRSTKALCCRRMMRDDLKRKTNEKNGKLGGNKALLREKRAAVTRTNGLELSGSVNPQDNPGVKAKPDPDPDPDPERRRIDNSSYSFSAGQKTPAPTNAEAERNVQTIIEIREAQNRTAALLLETQSQAKQLGELNRKTPRPRDLAMDRFTEQHEQSTGIPYAIEPNDAVKLAKLRNLCKTPGREKPPGWDGAVENFFASPMGQYSLGDLANPKRYAVFKNSPLDAYGKPILHQNNRRANDGQQRESEAEARDRRTKEAGERILARIVEKDSGGVSGRSERSDNGDLPRTAFPMPAGRA